MTTYHYPWTLLLHSCFRMMSSQPLLLLLEIFISPPRHSLAFFNIEFHSIAITSVLKAHWGFFGLVFLFLFFFLYDIQVLLCIANVSKPCVTSSTCYTCITIISENTKQNQDCTEHCVAPQAASSDLTPSFSTPPGSFPSSKPHF